MNIHASLYDVYLKLQCIAAFMSDLNSEVTRTFSHCIQSQNDFFVSIMFIPSITVGAVVLTPMTLKTVSLCL